MANAYFNDAFTVFDDVVENFTPEEMTEMNYYDILGDISTKIVNYREMYNLSQSQLAKKLGVAQSMISKYESGEYNFSLRTLNMLCGKLGFHLSVDLKENICTSSTSTLYGGSVQNFYDYADDSSGLMIGAA